MERRDAIRRLACAVAASTAFVFVQCRPRGGHESSETIESSESPSTSPRVELESAGFCATRRPERKQECEASDSQSNVDDTFLRVRVVDAKDRPVAGVPMVVFPGKDRREAKPPKATSRAPDGIARVDLTGLLEADDDPPPDLSVALCVPVWKQCWVAFDASALPAEPLTLRLPPCGRVRVSVEDPRASGVPLRGVATLVADSDDFTRGDSPIAPEIEIVEGRGEFEFVGVGTQFMVRLDLEGRRPDGVEGCLLGPGGTETTVSLVAQEPGPRLTGRLLDGQGRPWARRHVRAEIESVWGCIGTSEKTAFETDEQGGFSADCSKFRWSEYNSLELLVEGEPGVVMGRITSKLPAEFVPVIDVGDRIVEENVLWCAGVVVDDDGSPVPGAEVIGFARASSYPSAVTGEDGRFTLRGVACYEDATLTVLAGPAGFADCRDVPFTPCTRDVRIVVSRTRGLAGRVVLDPGVREGEVRVLLDGNGSLTANRVEDDGSFRFRSCAPGDYRVTFEANDGSPPTPLAVFEHVRVESGKVARDPRLQEVDLRGRIVHLELAVRDAAGDPVDLARVIEPAHADRPERLLTWIHAGRATLTLTHPTDLEVRSSGHRTAFVPAATGRVDVTLAPPLPVRVRVVPHALPIRLASVALRRAPVRDQEGERACAEFEGAESRPIDVGRPGPQVMTLQIAEEERFLEGDVPLTRHLEVHLAPEDALVTIADSPDEQWVEVRVDDEAVKRTLAAIEAARANGTLVR